MPYKTSKARRRWWANNAGYQEKQRALARTLYDKIQSFLRDHKVKVGCKDCGFNAHHAALEFHHEKDKDIAVSRVKSISRAISEMKKCVVLCSNCHAIRHWKAKSR